jgi:hypothetical protein
VPPLHNLTPRICEKLKRDMLEACPNVAETHGLFVEGGELTAIIHEASVFGAGRLFPAPSVSEE